MLIKRCSARIDFSDLDAIGATHGAVPGGDPRLSPSPEP
jgi:hypothetical protein